MRATTRSFPASVNVTPFNSAKGIFIELTFSSGVMIGCPIFIGFVIPGWSEGPDLRCAIAHRGISRFRVRRVASPLNDDLNGETHYHGCHLTLCRRPEKCRPAIRDAGWRDSVGAGGFRPLDRAGRILRYRRADRLRQVDDAGADRGAGQTASRRGDAV